MSEGGSNQTRFLAWALASAAVGSVQYASSAGWAAGVGLLTVVGLVAGGIFVTVRNMRRLNQQLLAEAGVCPACALAVPDAAQTCPGCGAAISALLPDHLGTPPAPPKPALTPSLPVFSSSGAD